MTLTALPAPDIEIGLRRPVNCILRLSYAHRCDPVHISKENMPRCTGAGQLLLVVVMARIDPDLFVPVFRIDHVLAHTASIAATQRNVAPFGVPRPEWLCIRAGSSLARAEF
jgi:hypothetical protein